MPTWQLAAFSTWLTLMCGVQLWIMRILWMHEKQLYRLVANYESEKENYRDKHKDFEDRIRNLEKHDR